jgi:hypothetical protein
MMRMTFSLCRAEGSSPEKIWANSGDSHFLEPESLWRDTLPTRLAELVSRTVKDPDGQ